MTMTDPIARVPEDIFDDVRAAAGLIRDSAKNLDSSFLREQESISPEDLTMVALLLRIDRRLAVIEAHVAAVTPTD